MAMPIIAEVRAEAWEAGQTRASEQDEGHVEQSVNHAHLTFPVFLTGDILGTATSGIKLEIVRFLFRPDVRVKEVV